MSVVRLGSVSLQRHIPKTTRGEVVDNYRGCFVVPVRESADLYRRVEGGWCGIVGSAGSAPERMPELARRAIRCGVIGSTAGFGPVSPGSSPGSGAVSEGLGRRGPGPSAMGQNPSVLGESAPHPHFSGCDRVRPLGVDMRVVWGWSRPGARRVTRPRCLACVMADRGEAPTFLVVLSPA